MERRFERKSFAPINVGDELDVKIEAVGAKGDGIAKVKGFVIFVPGAKEGETVRVKVTRVLRKVGFAETIGGATSEAESNKEASAEGTEESYEEDSNEEEYSDEEG